MKRIILVACVAVAAGGSISEDRRTEAKFADAHHRAKRRLVAIDDEWNRWCKSRDMVLDMLPGWTEPGCTPVQKQEPVKAPSTAAPEVPK